MDGPDRSTIRTALLAAAAVIAVCLVFPALGLAAANQPPATHVPGPQTTAEDSALTFSPSNLNGIGVSDPDDAIDGINGNEPVEVTLSASNGGTLTLSGTTALVFTAGANGTSSMTIRGAITDVDNALNGMVYRPVANYNGVATLVITANDLGNFGTGGPLTATSTIPVTITPVNDAPVNTVPGDQTVNEDTPLTFSTGNANRLTVGDVDDADDGVGGNETVRVTLTASNATLTLPNPTGLTFSAGTNGSSGMTFSGTLVSVNAALNGLTYAPNANFNGPSSVAIITNDLGNSGSGPALADTRAVSVTVNAVNDAPVNTVPGPQVTNQDANLVFSSAGGKTVKVSDPDDADDHVTGNEPLQVSLDVTHGTLTLSGTTGLTIPAGANGTSSMTLLGTSASINSALDGLTYTPDPTFHGPASFSLSTSDGGNFGAGGVLGAINTVPITVRGPNQPPVNSVPGAQTTPQDTARTFSAEGGNGISISDPDAGPANLVQVTLGVDNGTLTLPASSGLHFTAGSSGRSSMTFRGTLSDINAALNGLVYAPAPGYSGPATLTISTDDLGNTGSGGHQTDNDAVAITVEPKPPAQQPSGTPTGGGPTPAPTEAGDTTAPQTAIGKLTIRGATAVVTFTGADDRPGALRFMCSLDGGAFKPCKSPAKLKRLKRGRHSFSVKAIDAAGNADATPATKRFRVR